MNFVEKVQADSLLSTVGRLGRGLRQATLEDKPAPTRAGGSTGCLAWLHAQHSWGVLGFSSAIDTRGKHPRNLRPVAMNGTVASMGRRRMLMLAALRIGAGAASASNRRI